MPIKTLKIPSNFIGDFKVGDNEVKDRYGKQASVYEGL
jgi:hypothetical protein